MALTDFLSKDDQTRITDAITMAEKRTSGEICVHITPKCGGDEGINNVVPDDYWRVEKDTLGKYLSQGKPADGICEVVAQIGESLATYFPPVENDVNELSNDVSYSDDE